MFPSPCGEEVMKYIGKQMTDLLELDVSVPLRGRGHEIRYLLIGTLIFGFVSVPLRGRGHEILLRSPRRLRSNVSVPLRGRGHEIVAEYILETTGSNVKFPSPCGEEVMK